MAMVRSILIFLVFILFGLCAPENQQEKKDSNEWQLLASMLSVNSFLSQQAKTFFNMIFDKDASLMDLLQLTLVLAFVVFSCFSAAHPILLHLAQGPLKPFLWAVCEREYNQPSRLNELKLYGITISNKQEYFDKAIVRFWPNMMMIYTQHAISGLLTMPAVLGNYCYLNKEDASSLACFGILLEIGWEVQDVARILYYRAWKGDKEAFPTKLIVMKCVHHMTSLVGIPLILLCRDMPELHRLCFDMQLTSFLYGFCDEYSRTLDISKKPAKLVESMVCWYLVTIGFVCMRILDGFYLKYKILELVYSQEMWMHFTFLLVMGSIFSVFNIFATAICFQRAIEISQKFEHSSAG